MDEASRAATPKWFWIVALVSLIWNAFGVFDFVMTQIRDPDYLAQFPPEMMQMIDAFPLWVTAAWMLGVGGALAGSLLLLARSRFAVYAFAASLLGLVVSTAYQRGLDVPEPVNEAGMNAMTVVIWIAALAQLGYAAWCRRWRLLR